MESEAGTENRTPLGSLDFSKLTPSQFGITTNSFSPFPKDKDKSRVAQLKARRRSTIGVRGSPETNSLICFRAKQAMKTPPRTPQHLLESPMFAGRDSIKQKLAAFQRLMEIDEENMERPTLLLEQEEARFTPSGVNDGLEERENRLTPVSPPISKRRRRGSPHWSVWEGRLEEEQLSELTWDPEHELQVEFKSPKMAPSPGSQSELLSLPMLSKPEQIKTGEIEVSSLSKKKRVHFGAPLSPEFFDESLPPSTPLQKGATPACPPSSTGRKHSLLKTPQRFTEPLPQPNFFSPEKNGGSPEPTPPICSSDGVGVECEKGFLHNFKIPFLFTDEEYDGPLVDSKVEPEPSSEHKEQLQLPKAPRSVTKAPYSGGRKRKQPAEIMTTETRRSSRTCAKSATGKMKTSSAKKRFGTKDVDRSLYGKRDYASKNPLLSPIMESAVSSLSSTPAPSSTDENPDSSPAPILSTQQSTTVSSDATVGLMAAASMWRSRFLHQANDSNLDGELKDRGQDSGVSDTLVQLDASTKLSVAVSTCRAARGRLNSASRCQRGAKRRKEQKKEICQSEYHEFDQTEEAAGERSNSEMRTEPEILEKPRQLATTGMEMISMIKKEEPVEEESRLAEKTCLVTAEPPRNVEEQTERNMEDERQTSGHGVEEGREEGNEDPKLTPAYFGNLEPWQQDDFCIEDILKSVSKSRRSVRRSLRHRRSLDVLAVGLAWVERTSPQTVTVARRRTRGRPSTNSQHNPEETPIDQ